MKAKLLLCVAVLLLSYSTSYADCRSCCSRHGGVECIYDITQCRDGTELSEKCQAKACNKCPNIDITFAWQANTEADLAGYKLYYRLNSSGNRILENYTLFVTIGTETEYTIRLQRGKYYFVLTAFDTEGLESEASNEVSN